MHVLIDDDRCANSHDQKQCKRFKVSNFEGVEWDQLKPHNQCSITVNNQSITIEATDLQDNHQYQIQINPFRILYTINGTFVMETNHKDLLYFESEKSVYQIRVKYF